MHPDQLLDGLDPSQRRAVTSTAAPLAILAGAGSGKTRVLTRRIAYRCTTGDADARHVLALTFTRRAAEELDARLRAFGLRDLPAAGTFHAVAYAQLRNRWAAEGRAAPTLLDRKGRLLGRILGSTTRVSIGDLATEIEWAKARLVAPDGYPLAAARADRRLPVPSERIAEWFRRYEDDKRKRGLVDFDDLLARCTEAIESDPSFAAAQRWRFRHLFVDEYQDLNPLQERLLRAWLGDRPDLAVVGDPNQAIYGWNGADASFLVDFERHHPGAETVVLEDSYRSTPQILTCAAAVLDGGRPGSARLNPRRSDGPIPTITGYRSDLDEANGIARAVHDLHAPGRPWSAQAVLVRTNGQATVLEAAFRRAAIPHRVRGARRLLDEPEVIDLLRRLDRTREPLATTLADLDSAVLDQRAELARALDGPGDEASADDAPVSLVAEATAAGQRLAALEQVVRLGHDLLVVDPTARTEEFGGWLRTTLQDTDTDQRDAVTISTFHAAKGLEWSAVHVAGLEAGLVPITHARTPAEQAEEQRLLYVAVTRAADVLRCSWAAERSFGAQSYARSASPYLPWLRSAVAALASAESLAPDPEPALARSRAALRRAPSSNRPATAADEAHELREAIVRWRREVARGASVRPTVVLSDKAVEAIVRARPRSAEDLEHVGDVGPSVRTRHGERLLAIVADHASPPTPAEDPCASS